ncbi:hypothetical protein XELAEV_18015805mg [Xenopus laevis]|uniref:Uncharacterized protein n=1 Tax=Xenopus laevis TaxID=8355 RepID=A0A974DL80_XENLA|nr:hypothetical protein XELAEV_18015805mg [Xenopus laevis]
MRVWIPLPVCYPAGVKRVVHLEVNLKFKTGVTDSGVTTLHCPPPQRLQRGPVHCSSTFLPTCSITSLSPGHLC